MKVCIFGAGAVGGNVAVRLSRSGNDVTVVARGATADAISKRGLKLLTPEGELSARPRVCTDAAEAGAQDVVFVAVKSLSIPAATDSIAKLRGKDTPFVFALNGIPWWYPHGAAAARAPLPDLDFLDPGGRLAKALPRSSVLGAVVNSSNEVLEPGIVKNVSAGNVIAVGAPSPEAAAPLAAVRKLLEDGGYKSPPVADIRHALWSKLITANLANFPICTLLNAPLTVFNGNVELVGLAQAILAESIAVARAYGIEPDVDPAKAYDASRVSSPHKPSMAQDFAKGRPLEIDGVLLAVQKFARAAGVAMPRFDALMAILIQRAVEAKLYAR